MPFYELVCITGHYRQYATIRDLVRSTALHVMEHGGHVRSIESWGTHNLPEKTRRHKINHFQGDYWCMQFDCSPVTLAAMNAQYQIDPRVIKWTNIRLEDSRRIKSIVQHPGGTIGWGSNPSTFNSAAKRERSTSQTLLQEELLASIEARMARSKALEERLATRVESGASKSALLPPSMGLNAALQGRREAAKTEGGNIWSDITSPKKVEEAKAKEEPSP